MQEKVCTKCGLSKPLTEYWFRKTGPSAGTPLSICRKCDSKRAKANWIKVHGKDVSLNNKSCPNYLGIAIAETILSHEFPGFKRMPYGNPGYDYDCPQGFKIDVKSACIHLSRYGIPKWSFQLKKNKVPHFYIFAAFDNRTDLNLLHIWLIPGSLINTKTGIAILNTPEGLAKWSQYERSTTTAKKGLHPFKTFSDD